MVLDGSATTASPTRGANKVLRLTPAQAAKAGAGWYTNPVDVANGFKTTFQFLMPGGSDGLAFVIQNSPAGTSAVGLSGGGIGYQGIANSLAVEFDTWLNAGSEAVPDPTDNHVSVQTAGANPNSADTLYSLAHATPSFYLDNNVVHTATVQYVAGVLQVYVDSTATPLVNVAVNLAATLNLAGGKAWIGFTGATGGAYYQTQDILNWQYSTFVGTGSPLMAVNAPSSPQATTPLEPFQMQPLVAESLRLWQMTGINTDRLRGIDVRIADLPGTTLGLASDHTIWLDENAAGWGWFVDRTPGRDTEFTRPGDQGEQNHMDLLTVVMHEMGHLLGYEHNDDGVMAETLAAGVRRGSTVVDHDHVASIDKVFHETDNDRSDGWLGWWLSEQLEATRHGAKRRR